MGHRRGPESAHVTFLPDSSSPFLCGHPDALHGATGAALDAPAATEPDEAARAPASVVAPGLAAPLTLELVGRRRLVPRVATAAARTEGHRAVALSAPDDATRPATLAAALSRAVHAVPHGEGACAPEALRRAFPDAVLDEAFDADPILLVERRGRTRARVLEPLRRSRAGAAAPEQATPGVPIAAASEEAFETPQAFVRVPVRFTAPASPGAQRRRLRPPPGASDAVIEPLRAPRGAAPARARELALTARPPGEDGPP